MTFTEIHTQNEIIEVISLAEMGLRWAQNRTDGHPSLIPTGPYTIEGFSETTTDAGTVINVIGRRGIMPSSGIEAHWRHISLPLAEWKRIMIPAAQQ